MINLYVRKFLKVCTFHFFKLFGKTNELMYYSTTNNFTLKLSFFFKNCQLKFLCSILFSFNSVCVYLSYFYSFLVSTCKQLWEGKNFTCYFLLFLAQKLVESFQAIPFLKKSIISSQCQIIPFV